MSCKISMGAKINASTYKSGMQFLNSIVYGRNFSRGRFIKCSFLRGNIFLLNRQEHLLRSSTSKAKFS